MRRRYGFKAQSYRLFTEAKKQASRIPVIVYAAILLVGIVGTTAGLMLRDHHKAEAITPPVVLGLLPYQKMVQYKLTDKASLAVNAANGNVVMQTQDMSINGTGPAFNVTRYFNDLGSGSGQVGSHTTLSVGADVHLTANSEAL